MYVYKIDFLLFVYHIAIFEIYSIHVFVGIINEISYRKDLWQRILNLC